MRHILLYIFIAAALVLSVSGCEKENKKTQNVDIVGKWELVDMQTKSVQIGSYEVTVFLDFRSDKTFSLSQKLGDGRAREFSGTWSLTGNTLSGKYSDGTSWGAGYKVKIEDEQLIMETVDKDEIFVYNRK